MTKIIVINLDGAEERWTHILHQLEKQGLGAERFPGVNGKAEEHPLFARYNSQLRLRLKGNPLSRGQLGCFASHFLVWKRCVALGEPVIVLEDDVTLPGARLKEFMKQVDHLDPRFECVRLFENKTKHHRAVTVLSLDRFEVLKYTKGPMSAMGYYLTPKGARKLLSGAETWFLAVDMYMDRFWANGVECFGVTPDCVQHDYIFESMIGYEDDRVVRPLSVTARRELFSSLEGLRRFLHNFKFRLIMWSRNFCSTSKRFD